MNEPWWFAELDPINRSRAEGLFAQLTAAQTMGAQLNTDLLAAVRALLAAADHTLPSEWRKDRPVSFAKAAIAKAEGR